MHAVDAGLLPALGVPLVSGRNIRSSDQASASPVVLVSRALAERMGGVRSAIDRELIVDPNPAAGAPDGSFRVVGVVENVAYDGLVEQDTRRYIRYGDAADAGARLDAWFSLAQFPERVISIGVFTRARPDVLIDPLRRRIADVAPTSAVHWTSTMSDELALEYAPSRFYAVLVAAFSTSALLLTAVGLFAVLSHRVARRTREIGLRIALGATPADAAQLILRGGLAPLAAGIGAGLIVAAGCARLLGGVLYGVPPLDPVAFAGAALLLIVVGLPAAILPARRAATLDPMRALNRE